MAKAYEIPLSPQAQTFSIQLGGVGYKVRIYWGGLQGCWLIDLLQGSGAPLVQGIPVVTGIDLLAQYAYLGIGGSLIAQTDNNADAVPTFANLGQTGRLYFVAGS